MADHAAANFRRFSSAKEGRELHVVLLDDKTGLPPIPSASFSIGILHYGGCKPLHIAAFGDGITIDSRLVKD